MATRRSAGQGSKKAATAEEILNRGSRPAKIPVKWQKYHDRLVGLRDALLQRRAEVAKDALTEGPTFSMHEADAGTDSYDRDFALGMLSTEQDAIYEVDEAINRILNGNYGICELTGKPIESQRLEVVPWTRFSAASERELERDGALKHARLGPRETVGRTAVPQKPEELS